MFAFELSEVEATLEHLNTRTENSRPDDVPATTLRLNVKQSADVLSFFTPELKGNLFDFNAGSDLGGDLPARMKDPHMVYPIARDEEMTGATLTIDHGVKSKMVLADCVIKDFRITPYEGGTVALTFNVNCHPDAWKDLPALYLKQKQAITVTIEPAELPEMKAA